MILNDTFGKVFVINLDRRPDRMAEIATELDRIDLTDYERVSAVDGSTVQDNEKFKIAKGNVGCILSHLTVVKTAKEREYDSYVVLEDDVELHPEFVQLLTEWHQELPEEWDCLFFGGSHVGGLRQVSEHVSRMGGSYTTHAMAIHSRFYDKLIDAWGSMVFDKEVDVAMADLHADNMCYAFHPPLAFQRAGYSDILEKYDDYKHLRKGW